MSYTGSGIACGLEGSVESAQSLVAQELVPWALGYIDPVRDRVQSRQREASGDAADAPWAEEIRRRVADVRAGHPGIPADQVIEEARARLEERRGE
mgnify:CR=1 FL=1